jgi:hypothetical protein
MLSGPTRTGLGSDGLTAGRDGLAAGREVVLVGLTAATLMCEMLHTALRLLLLAVLKLRRCVCWHCRCSMSCRWSLLLR